MVDTGAPTTKHFLDTSVVRPLLHGSTAYRDHLAKALGDKPWYISEYVAMEVKRGFLLHIINFYFVLTLPTVKTIGDALSVWSQKFAKGDLKAILALVGQLLDTEELDTSKPRDLVKAQQAIGRYVKRINAKLHRQFRDPSKDTTRCARAQVPLKADLASLSEDLGKFAEEFGNTDGCRSRCRIDTFLLNRYRQEISSYAALAAKLPRNKATQGFLTVAEQLQKVLDSGGAACSCAHCEKIGDAVIALDANRTMCLDHTDRSFEHLCPPIHQLHHLHPSETEVHKQGPAAK